MDPARHHDNGAGFTKKFGEQWCHAGVCISFLTELEDYSDSLTKGEMWCCGP